jgi:hypothetical protein
MVFFSVGYGKNMASLLGQPHDCAAILQSNMPPLPESRAGRMRCSQDLDNLENGTLHFTSLEASTKDSILPYASCERPAVFKALKGFKKKTGRTSNHIGSLRY